MGLLEFIDLDTVIAAQSGNPIAYLAALGHDLLNAALTVVAALMGATSGSGLMEPAPIISKGLASSNRLATNAWPLRHAAQTSIRSRQTFSSVVSVC